MARMRAKTQNNNNTERIFVIGGTGNTGQQLVRDLIKADIPTTLYARDPAKVNNMFPGNKLTIVKGDLSDLKPLKEAIQGHTRLFMVVTYTSDMPKVKPAVAEIAYGAGVKQIIDVSGTVNLAPGWRQSLLGVVHFGCEKAILQIPNRGAYVTLRPARFMSNLLRRDVATIKSADAIMEAYPEDMVEEWISPDDIGALAAIILQEPIEKHADAVYEMVGDWVTASERAAIFSKILGREIKFQQVPASVMYEMLTTQGGIPHLIAYSFVRPIRDYKPVPNDLLSILLKRKPQTLEEWITANKQAFL